MLPLGQTEAEGVQARGSLISLSLPPQTPGGINRGNPSFTYALV